MVKEIEKEERKGYIIGKKYSRLFEQLHKAREIADYNPLAPKYDRGDASGYIRIFSEVVPGIIEMIRNYDKYSMPVTRSVEELKLLTQQ